MNNKQDVELINRQLEIAILTDGQTVPITDWFDENGVCDKEDAIVCICGPCSADRWYSVELRFYENVTVR